MPGHNDWIIKAQSDFKMAKKGLGLDLLAYCLV